MKKNLALLMVSILVQGFIPGSATAQTVTQPSITSQTPSQVVLLGSTVTFSVTANGTDPLSYLWSRNSTPIPDATNSSYTLFNVQLTDSGSKFSCLVTNAYGSAASTNASLKVIDTISNDLCSGAVVITGSTYTNMQSTAQASSNGDPEPDCIDGFGNGVWYQFTAPLDGMLYVDTFGSDFDTGLAAYTGSCGSLTEVACNDDTIGVTSQVILPATAGTTYYFLAGGYGGHVGNLVFHLNYLTPPAFDVQPTNLSVAISSNAVFSPTVSGSLPMSFQWYFNSLPLADGGRISGSASSTLTIANVQTNDGGNYQVVASNMIGVTTSSVAVLTPVIVPPFFIQPPVSQSIGAGSNANFFAVVGGTPPFNYQWTLNGNPLVDDGVHIAGSATASLTISNLTTADTGDYALTVTNGSGVPATVVVVLNVLVPPAITQQPVGRSVPPGLPTTLSASAFGIPTPNLQWQLNDTNIPGATGTNYSIAAVSPGNLGFYQLVASNSIGITVSSNAQLTFGPVAVWSNNIAPKTLPPPGLSNVFGIAAGNTTSFALRTDGHIVAWGSGPETNIPPSATNVVAMSSYYVTADCALRSDGTVVSWNSSIQTPSGLSNIVSVAVGENFGSALRAEGTLTNWGQVPFPGFPAGLSHITAIASDNFNVVALRDNGTVVVSGGGPVTNVPAGLSNVVAIAAGGNNFAMALRSDGTVVAWGTAPSTNLPPGLSNIVAIACNNFIAGNSGMAIRSDGALFAWGNNSQGEANPPPALTNLTSIAGAAGSGYAMALVNDGRPVILQPPVGLTAYSGRNITLKAQIAGAAPLSYQWLLHGTNVPGGTNVNLIIPNIQPANAGNYQLFVSNAIASAVSLPAPVNVISNNTLTFIGQTTVSSTNVYQGGTVAFFGGAVLGNGPLRYQWYSSPTNKNFAPVSGATNDTLVLDPALAVQSGLYYLAVSNVVGGITSAPVTIKVQFARAWGFLAVSNPPVNVTNAIAVATGGYNETDGNYLALGADGKVTAWANFAIAGETNVSALSNVFVTAIAAGNADALALKSDGTVYAWGFGQYGETNPPTGLNSVVAIACGAYHDLALKADGTVVGWGGIGQGIGFGQTTNNPAATNVVAIAAGTQHSLALRADGTVVAWGNSVDGSTSVPPSATDVVTIAAGTGFSEALRANGTVVQWGTAMLSFPVPLGLSNVVAISASESHATALRNDGTVVSWGNNSASNASNSVPPDLANVIAIASGGNHDIALFGNRAPAFTVQPWNQSVFNTTTSVLFAAKCEGVQPVTYQWKLNGTNVPAATNDTLTASTTLNGQKQTITPLQSGVYQLIASNAYGVVASKFAKLTVLIPLGVAVNATNLNWTTTGSAQWFGQTNFSHDGVSAARSGGIGASQETILQTTLATNVPGNVSFWWKVSSELDFDILEFRLNGISLTNISGEVDWQQVIIPIPAGTNVLQWRYSKDPTFDSGLDAGFMDQFVFLGPPQILRQPAPAVTANAGGTINLTVLASGAPTIGYQWQQNGNPVGINSQVLILNNVGRAQDGTYSVIVTNAGGAVVSSNSLVHVNVPQILGMPALLPNGSLQVISSDIVGGGTLSPSDLTNFEAQTSIDLVNWVTLPNSLSLTNGMLLLQDNSLTNYPTRYYRIIEH